MLALLLRALGRIPLTLLHSAGLLVGWCVFLFSPRYAKRMRTNLDISGLARTPAEYRRLLHAAIAQNGRALTELPAVWFRSDDAVNRLVTECRGWEEVRALRRRGRKIIFLSPHMGCFEILARYLAAQFPLTVMYRPQQTPWLNALMESGRTSRRLELAPTNLKGVRMLYNALRRGESIGLLPDHAPGLGEGVWATFFGAPAFTMTLPRKLQRSSGAALMLTFGERLPRGKGYRLHFEALSDCDFDEQKMNQAIEDLVRRYPDQYYWNYNRFKKMSGRRQRRRLQSRPA